jgi:hypothetical protein
MSASRNPAFKVAYFALRLSHLCHSSSEVDENQKEVEESYHEFQCLLLSKGPSDRTIFNWLPILDFSTITNKPALRGSFYYEGCSSSPKFINPDDEINQRTQI